MASPCFSAVLALIKNQPGDNVALQTHSFIQSQATYQARIDAIENILHCADAEVGSFREVILEAWSLLRTKEVWCHGYTSEAQAMEAFATPSLERLIPYFARQRSEKCRYRQSIQERWNLAIPAVDLDRAGENYLYQMEVMTRKWSCANQALTLVTHIAIKGIQEAKEKQQHIKHHGGRGEPSNSLLKIGQLPNCWHLPTPPLS